MSCKKLLANRDILDIIFEQLSSFPQPLTAFKDHHTIRTSADAQENRRALASAACASRSFVEPASHVLWRVMPHGIIPLLHIFKNLKRCRFDDAEWGSAEAYKEYEYELEGEVTEKEWKRFDQLAIRVRGLIWDIHLGPLVSQAVITRYEGRRASILPNLQLLSWQDSNGDAMQQCVLRVFSIPSLRYLHFFRDDWQWPPGNSTHPPVQDLSIITDIVPGIPHLNVHTSVILTASSPLIRLRYLRTLRLYADIDEALYRYLAAFPHLEHPHFIGCTTPYGSTPRGFPALRTLELQDRRVPPPYMKLLPRLNSPSLTSLTLRLSVTNNVNCIPLIQQMCTLPALHQLIHLRLYLVYTHVVQSEALDLMPFAFGEVVGPLLELRRLEELYLLSKPWALSVSDEDVAQIQRARPCLRRLVFSYSASGYAVDPNRVVRPSLPALIALVDSCLALEELFIEVADITDDDIDRAEAYLCTEDTFRPQRALRQFLIGRFDGSPVGLPYDLDRLVKVLRRAFPRIDGVGAHPGVQGRLRELARKLRET
ncbi:hypothetical protein C8Q80DRAFT_431679 [Daedaleopsis nitida]|nr:hypothetical protein C8Q80DRAFT_431679 [Daedaleopsis nitida]